MNTTSATKKYIALLRGINVGGHTVKMETLRAFFENMGFKNVRSYIQSGNVFFEASNEDTQKMAARIEKFLYIKLGYGVPVFVRTVEEFENTVSNNPFKKIKVTDDMRPCIIFMDGEVPPLTLPYWTPKKDIEIVATSTREVYAIWHVVNGRPPAATALDKVLGKRITTRFYHTAHKILAAAHS